MTHPTWQDAVGLTILMAIGTMTFPCAGEIVEVELIPHGDMECSVGPSPLPTGWSAIGTMTGGISTDTPDASVQSLFNHNDSGGSDWGPFVRYVANIPPGMTEYKLSYWHKGGTWYSTLYADSSSCLADLAGSATWTHYELPWRDNAPGASVFRLYLYAHWNGVPVLFDNVSLKVKVPAPLVGVEVLSNGDFELGGSPTTPPTDWNYGNDGVVGVTNEAPDCSSQSLLVFNDGTGAYEGLARQDQPIAPGATLWKLSFSYRGDNPRWHLFDESHATLDAAHPADDFPGGSGQRQHSVWTDYTTEWKPNTVDSGMMRLSLYDISNNAEPTLFDNVSLLVWYPPPKGSLIVIK